MPAVKRPGKVGLYVELSEGLDARLRAYCERIGSGVAEQVRLALERHLAYPPAETVPPPLPDGVPAGVKRKRPGKAKGRAS
jgi:hypothetical protein